jgi:ankyrin repeat protein
MMHWSGRTVDLGFKAGEQSKLNIITDLHLGRKLMVSGLVVDTDCSSFRDSLMRIELFGFLSMGLLLLSGCVTNPNVTPLMKAAKSGDADNVQQLIDGGTNIDEESAYGWTALMFASWQGHEEVVRFLLKSGASTDHVSGQVPSRFETTTGHPPTTALAEAIRDEHFEVANILVDHGASPNPAAVTLAAQKGNTVLLEKLLKKGADLNVSNNSEHFSTALSAAAGKGRLETVKWLLGKGTDINLLAHGKTALEDAVGEDRVEIVRYLLGEGADPNLKSEETDEDALFYAATRPTSYSRYKENLAIIKLLLANGANRNLTSFDSTVLQFVRIQYGNSVRNFRKRNDAGDDPDMDEYIAHRKAIISLLEKL